MSITPPGQIVWTVTPNGWSTASDGTDLLNLSVVVTPHPVSSSANATLVSADFTVLQNWPAVVSSSIFELSVGSLTQPVPSLTRVSPAPDPSLWTSLFPLSLSVPQYQFDQSGMSQKSFNSYPVQQNVQTLVDVYRRPPGGGRQQVQAGGEHPLMRLARLTGVTEEEYAAAHAKVYQLKQRYGTLQAVHAFRAENLHPDAVNFLLMDQYYSGLAQGAKNRFADHGKAPIEPPVLDFQQVLSGFGRFPNFLRALGLILDFTVPAASFASAATDDKLWLAPVVNSGAFGAAFSSWTHTTLSTAYHLDRSSREFLIRTLPPSDPTGVPVGIDSGMLFLPAETDFTVTPIDLDHLAYNTRGVLQQIRRQLSNGIAPDAVAIEIPAPRSSGFLFARSDLAACIQTILTDQAALNAAIEANPSGVGVEAGAEQLLRGVRVDISSDGGQTWLSLCKRAVSHTPDSGAAAISYEDEGYVPLKLFNPDLATAGAPLWTHESLFRWSGWSLCVPRPGLAIQDGSTLVGDDDQGSSNLPAKTKVTPPAAGRTLPRLRYGVTYLCRLRVVDLAGNSFSLNAAIDPRFNVPLGTYLRFDPITSPTMLLKQATGPGEFVDCMVIHSDFNSPSVEIGERYIAPPKTSIECALWHGALDVPSGVDASAYNTLVQLDGAFSDVPYGAAPPSLPYLPDPVARGASFDLEPGVQQPQSVPLQAPFSGTWPSLRGVRLLLQEGAGGPVSDVTNGTLTFNLLKSQTRQFNLACFANPADFLVFDYITHVSNQQSVLTLAEQSRVPQLTPPRLITLVHAVQRPLAMPVLQLHAFRVQTTATLEGVIAIHGGSTGSVDFFGSWQEPLDDGINAPSINSFTSRVARANPAVTDSSTGGFMHHLNDTKYRRVTYWAVATTRFLEYFPKSVTDDPAQITQTSNLSVVDVPCSAPPPAPKVLYAIPTFRWTKTNTANSMTHQRRCGVRVYLDRPWYVSGDGELLGVVVATLFTAPTGSGGDGGGNGGGGGGGKHPFQNGSANVVPPRDLPVITGISPNHGAAAGGETVTITGLRFAGLRAVTFGTNAAQSVNFISGTEITAVSPAGVGTVDITVTTDKGTSNTTDADEFTYPPQPAPNMDPQMAPFVTQWGADPLFAGANMPAGVSPIPVNFPNQLQSISVAFLTDAAGIVDPSRMVVLFDVQFEPPDPANPLNRADPGKTPHNGRWYADIEIDSGGAYYPFLRLAMVRCQLNGTGASQSPRGLTSPAVLADVVQIAPDRTASISFDPAHPDQAVLTVSGPSYAANDTSDNTQRPAPQASVDIQVNIGTVGAPAWIQSSSSQLLVQDTSRGLSSCVWTGTIKLPAAIGSTPMRVTLREEELLPVDGAQTDVNTIGLASRLVFADSFEIGAFAPPAITSVTPAAGGVGGGTAVTITGTGFQGLTGVASVSFGNSPAAQFEVISDAQINVTSPPGSGSVGITVATGAGAFTSPADSFTYGNPIPAITNVFPLRASAGDTVTLTGSGFTGMTAVSFGTAAATNFTEVSDTQATTVVPAGKGTVDITVTTAGGTSSTSSADQFTFAVSVPVITSVSPSSGSASGGDIITLTGSGFTGVSGIKFGNFTPSNFFFLSDSEIIVVTGSGTGTVGVTVVAAGGISASSPAAQFTFV
jgi:hypothetical protein